MVRLRGAHVTRRRPSGKRAAGFVARSPHGICAVPEDPTLLWGLLALAAQAQVPPTAYDRTIDLVAETYLHPEALDPVRLLQAAAEGLGSQVDWLFVTPVDDGVDLAHGTGAPIGSVTVASLATLPDALRALETTVADAGHPLDSVDVRLALLEGVCGALDRYSAVLSGDRARRFDVRLRGTVVGVGIEIDGAEGDEVVITRIVPGSPAEQAGVKVGDVLLRIDARSTVQLPNSEVRRLVQGDEGSAVTLTVRRDGASRTFPMTRAEVVVPNVEARALPGRVGYLRITHVSQRTVQNLLAELDTLRAGGAMAAGLVLDLRGNTGGSMKESAYAADLFVTSGALLRTVGRDGGPVANLEHRIDAVQSGTEITQPVAILVDGSTASGAEILAGALVELGRAVVVGTRTYGKGTVQKPYVIDARSDVELKLTVAEYVLANDRKIGEDGITPDVTVGEIALDGTGVRYRGWDPWVQGVAWEEILPAVTEHAAWRGVEDGDRDVALEIARRTVIAARAPTRDAGLSALTGVAAAVRAEEEARLVAALKAKGVDWTPAAADAGLPDADVSVKTTALPGDRLQVQVQVVNRDAAPLHRTLVALAGPSIWSGLVVPVGRVPAGGQATGAVTVAIPPGIEPREDEVGLQLRSDRRPALRAEPAILRHGSTLAPPLRVTAHFVAGAGPDGQAEIAVRNLGAAPVPTLSAAFAYPEDVRVELLDASATAPVLAPQQTLPFRLQLRLGADAPEVLPLEIVLESGTFGDLAQWPLPLPRNGAEVALQAPVVTFPRLPPAAPAGPLTLPVAVQDDHGLDHVTVWVNGAKVLWVPGGPASAAFDARVQLAPGANRVTVVAMDDQGVPTRRSVVIRGVSAR